MRFSNISPATSRPASNDSFARISLAAFPASGRRNNSRGALENQTLQISYKDNLAKEQFLEWLEDAKRTNFSDEKVDEKQMLLFNEELMWRTTPAASTFDVHATRPIQSPRRLPRPARQAYDPARTTTNARRSPPTSRKARTTPSTTRIPTTRRFRPKHHPYILHYTPAGRPRAGPVCGSGMTGVAAQMCPASCGPSGDIPELKDRVGPRACILNDLSPAACHIAYNYNTPVMSRRSRRIV